MMIALFRVILILFVASEALAYQPIAHTDVVPYQRVEYGESFKFGVVAFSKPGISRVDFDISPSSGTYTCSADTGETCVDSDTVRTTTMRLNTRVASTEFSGVWEYYITLKSSEFSANTNFTVTPTVTDENSNTRVLDAVTMIAEGSSAYSHNECWVDEDYGGGDSTANDETKPFTTIQAAVTACQTANSGSSSGNIIYLDEDADHSIASLSASTSGEWLTITKESGASTSSVIINQGSDSGAMSVNDLKMDGVTLESQGNGQEILHESQITYNKVWTNSCRFIGSGRSLSDSNPVYFHHRLKSDTDRYYSTDDYTYNVNNAYLANKFIRGAVVETVRTDVFHEYTFVINSKVDDLTNGGTGVHADVLQQYQNVTTTVPMQNTIAYNVYATNARYQGIMRNNPIDGAEDNAFINVFIEMREPGDEDEGGQEEIKSMLNEAAEDHFLMWHCSFPWAHVVLGSNLTNSSVVGNLFWQLRSSTTGTNTDFLYNHYMHVYGVTSSCTPSSWDNDRSVACPAPSSVELDTGSSTSSNGGGVVDISTPGADDFGYPIEGSDLIDALSTTYVPCDVLGNARDSSPDIGALEYEAEASGSSKEGISINQ